ncbi:hypothetical protein ACFQX8_19080 [Klenkia terrae]|uniref:hypothetical protein n=1 Tax=Klenkia terrae TaxID=1052259 RepID=UPI00361BA26C
MPSSNRPTRSSCDRRKNIVLMIEVFMKFVRVTGVPRSGHRNMEGRPSMVCC